MCPKITMQKVGVIFTNTAGNSCLFLSESSVKEKMKLKCQSYKHVVEGRDKSFCTVPISNNSIFKFMLIVNFYLQISKMLLRTLPSNVELQKLQECTSSFTFCPTK